MMSGEPWYGLVLFGLGRSGTIHLKNLMSNNRARLFYVVDLDVPRCQQFIDNAHLTEQVKVLHPDNQQQVFDDKRVVGVLVCSPTFTHEAIVKAALQNNKHVFCEKPVSEDEKGIEACYAEAKLAGKTLMCSLNRRFDPSIRRIKDEVAAGELGDVFTVKTCSRDNPVPSLDYLKISGGIFHDCAVHDVDMMCWILQDYPISVFTHAHAYSKGVADLDDVDTVAIVCKFASGALGLIDLSRHGSYGYDQRLEVHGSKGMLQSENQRPNGLVSHTTSGTTSSNIKYSFPQRYEESYKACMEHFFNAIDGSPLDISRADVLKACKVVSACEESYRTGLPISLEW